MDGANLHFAESTASPLHDQATDAASQAQGKPHADQRANNLRRRQWAAAVAGAGLDGFTFHDMRHTAVSLWVAAGASDLEVAKWAGHRSAAFTKSRYAHLFPEHGEALADRLEAFITASTSTPAATVTQIRPA